MNWLMEAALAADSDGVDVAVLGQYGVLGVFAILLILFARVSYKRETDRSDRLELENARLNQWVQEKAIPALLSSARANEDSQELLKEMYQGLKDLYGTPIPPARRARRPPDEETP